MQLLLDALHIALGANANQENALQSAPPNIHPRAWMLRLLIPENLWPKLHR